MQHLISQFFVETMSRIISKFVPNNMSPHSSMACTKIQSATPPRKLCPEIISMACSVWNHSNNKCHLSSSRNPCSLPWFLCRDLFAVQPPQFVQYDHHNPYNMTNIICSTTQPVIATLMLEFVSSCSTGKYIPSPCCSQIFSAQ